jgi:hypothetical protein
MDYFEQKRAARRQAVRTETRARPTRVGSNRVNVDRHISGTDGAGAFVYGIADTVTFGFLDEAGAALDHVILGKDYETALRDNRAIMGGVQERNSKSYLAGQIGGALVGGIGGVKALGGSAIKVGAAEGALYGLGSAEGDFKDRLKGAAMGGAIGASGGWLLGKVVAPGAKWGLDKAVSITRWGKTPKLTTEIASPAIQREGAEELGAMGKELRTGQTAAQRADGSTPKINTITGKADDEIEDGALFSMRELLGEAGAARKALDKRLGKMTAVQAQHIADRIERSMADGAQIDDPHFRSLLGFDVDDADIDADKLMNAISILEDGAEAVIAKAGSGVTRTNRSVQDEAREQMEQGVLLNDLSAALERSKKGVPDQVVAQHAQLYAGVSFIRAKDKFLPLIKSGVEGSREALAEALTKSAHIAAMARGIGSNAGRALQVRKAGGTGKLTNVHDDVFEMESLDEIRKRIDGSLKELGDDELTTLLGKLRTADDIGRINDILTDANKAREWTGWQRTMNSVSSWLKSNALTPATGLFNTISFVGHDFFRNNLARSWAARGMEKAGRLDDALALRFEREVGQRVYWEAHRRGLKAMLNRVQWEGWGAIEKIAAVARGGTSTLAAKARLKQTTMLTKGFKAPDIREFEVKAGIGVADVGLFNDRLASRAAEGGALARLINVAERAAVATTTTIDELGQASMKLFTGAVDDYGRQFMTIKETYAQSARFAIREAMEQGLPQDEMLKYAQKRAQELAEMPPSEILQRVEQKLLRDGELDEGSDLAFMVERERAVELEASRTLLMDGPQTKAGRAMAATARHLDKWAGMGQVEGVLMPYINTPIRIFERGLVSYNKRFALQCEETIDILKKGGVEADIEMARIELGTMAFKLGAILGGTGALTLTNGGFNNSANLDAGPPNRINFPGGGYVEIGRLDPFALMVSVGGLLGQSVNAGYHAYDEYKSVDEGLNAVFQTAYFASKDAVLEKSYLTSLQDLMEIVMGRDEGGAGKKLAKFLEGTIARTVPMSGISKQLSETMRDSAVESIGFADALLRSIPGGALFMAPKIDALGDEVKSRELGISAGDSNATEDREISPVKARLRELGIDIVNLSRLDGGKALDADQVSELRRIRGKEALNKDGDTMEQALETLFETPEFTAGGSADRHDMVIDVMNDFNEEAKAILEERNQNYLSTREANRAFRDYLKDGLPREKATERAREDVIGMGLPEPAL